MKWKVAEQFSVPHNCLDDSDILRKGAISAKKVEPVVIPANMRDGIILADRIVLSEQKIIFFF